MPIPPYMPMQSSTSKKSASLERKIKKKKEYALKIIVVRLKLCSISNYVCFLALSIHPATPKKHMWGDRMSPPRVTGVGSFKTLRPGIYPKGLQG